MSHPTPTTPREFAVAPSSPLRLLWLWVPLLIAAALVLGTALQSPQRSHSELVVTLPFILVLGLVLSWGYSRRRIVLEGAELVVRSTFYRKRVAVSAMRLEQARVVDLAEHGRYRPTRKTNGYGMPGFRSGHFRMADRSKAFCLLTDNSRVLYLPLRDGSALLLSPAHPQQLLQALQALAEPAHGV